MSMQLSVFTRYAIRSLVANRTRTVVTAAGVALACALLTFVLVLVGSLRAGLITSEAALEGAWQVSFSQIGEGQLARVEDELGDPLAVRRDLGAALTGDAEVPLLNVVTTLTGEKDLVVEPPLSNGRWPEVPDEIAVPAYWAETWPVGSTVELSLGRRHQTSGGISAYEYPPSYELDEKGVAQLAEELVDVGEPRALTVVGIVDGDADVAYVCPDEPGFGPEPLAFAWAAPDLGVDELDQVTEGICEQGGYSSYHNALLEYLSLGSSRGFDMSVGFIGACASALACLVTVTLISGSFRVSVAERVRQFGLLSSAGASRRQLVCVVLAEASMLCAVGVPVGLVLGVALDAVALSLAADGTTFVTGGLPIALSVEPIALLVAAGVSVAAVFVGALAPALRASRLPAVEAMRNGGNAGVRRRRKGPPRVLQARSMRRFRRRSPR
ncbi:MAG TPA: ABC transporter permease, partial [Candidatus Olsenella pullicola]|nr:ABC transporter permease [Candidatus Olsenella pullicola]